MCLVGACLLSRLLHCPLFLLTHVWELFPIGNQCDNAWSLKPLSSFRMWRNFINQLGNNENDLNLNICIFDRVLSNWLPTRKASHAGANRKTKHEDRAVKEAWEGRDLAEHICDSTWGEHIHPNSTSFFKKLYTSTNKWTQSYTCPKIKKTITQQRCTLILLDQNTLLSQLLGVHYLQGFSFLPNA
jgi:hypothetical protein